MMNYKISILCCLFLSQGCSKNKFKWELDRSNPHDKHNTISSNSGNSSNTTLPTLNTLNISSIN